MIEMKKSCEDRKLVLVGLMLLGVTVILLAGYQLLGWIFEKKPYAITEEMERKKTIDKYETPEEVAEYVLYWICQGDLELALRGCAIEEVAEGFSLQDYCEVLNIFPYTETLAPADYDSTVYMELNRMRIQAVYSDMVEQCIGILGDGYDVEVLGISAAISEDADGYYYQAIRDVCGIVGARDACNVKIWMNVDGIPREMTITVGKFKQKWKVIQFSEYANYQYTEPQISEYAETDAVAGLPIVWEDMETQILPCNSVIVADNSEEEIETLISKWFLYMQRGDIKRAMSYFDIYDASAGLYPDSIFFERQNLVAKQLQKLYYDLFLFNEDSLNWIDQNAKEEAANLVSLLDTNNLIFTEFRKIEILKQEDDSVRCKVSYRYSRKGFSCKINLVYREGVGWKISKIK